MSDVDEGPQTYHQSKPCRRCPFGRKAAREQLAEACEGGEPLTAEMLCHESGCLEGAGKDYYCRGFELNVERLRKGA